MFLIAHRAREALRACLPEPFRDGTFAQLLKDDSATKQWLARVLKIFC